eukprot:CAMPEP_0204867376 /NCGR_PEP_ID=MMETSP1348-20121228/22388_1 /ASSEMBLY_ACC=CAM_ASM_000700 /TAXON_ID=215587 /ORGANISM="Aplanochytrium stocchinoi, Strain GSBS06" /LENGTH=438 /DNA_ID=CAMNT_0052019781 /DNA_START=146 /DNA_END=1459 /DNA_ORIENTATION=-
MKYYFDVDKDKLAQIISQVFVQCIFGSYVIYCLEGNGVIFLPTLSTTWDFKPGNFLSRWCIGTGCVGLYLVQILAWKGHKLAHWLYLMAFMSVFFLSVVGAVCSNDTSVECYGNKDIHYAAAFSFFALFDVYMAINLFKMKKPEEKALVHALYMKLSLLVSVLSKIRMVESFGSHGDFPFFAVFEYLNVAAIITFNVAFISAIPENLNFSLVRLAENENLDDSNFLWTMSGGNTLQIALRYATGTLLSCLVTALSFQTVDPDQFPMISDTFVYPPGNYISRWAGIIGCTYLQLANFCIVHCFKQHMRPFFYRLCGAISVIAAFALSVVVVVSENEDKNLHFPAAITFFGGYLLLIGLVPLGLYLNLKNNIREELQETLLSLKDKEKTSDNPKMGIKLFALWFFVACMTKVRYSESLVTYLHFPSISNDVRSVIAIIEW